MIDRQSTHILILKSLCLACLGLLLDGFVIKTFARNAIIVSQILFKDTRRGPDQHTDQHTGHKPPQRLTVLSTRTTVQELVCARVCGMRL